MIQSMQETLKLCFYDNKFEVADVLFSDVILKQDQLDEAMKSRLTMITRQVREVKNVEDEVRQMRRQLDNFDR